MSAIEAGSDFFTNAIGGIKKLGLMLTTAEGSASYVDFAKLSRVEPTVIVSPDCMNLDYMPQINQSLLSIFMAYYLQGVDMLATVSDASTVRVLEMLNPNRSMLGTFLSFESRRPCYDYSLLQPSMLSYRSESVEEQNQEKEKTTMGVYDSNSNIGNEKISLHENVNLSIGRMMDVTLETVDKKGDPVKRTVKMNFRLMVSSLSENIITSILTKGTADRSFIERFHAWRSGRLGFIRDLIFCQDIIDEKYNLAVEDKNGQAADIFQRISKNKAFGVLNASPSLGNSTNIFVISEEIASQVEAKLGGKLTDFRIRQKMFEQSYAMIIVVVNRETSRMKFFVRNQPDYSNLSRKEIDGYSKGGKGPDVMEIFRSLQTASFSNF